MQDLTWPLAGLQLYSCAAALTFLMYQPPISYNSSSLPSHRHHCDVPLLAHPLQPLVQTKAQQTLPTDMTSLSGSGLARYSHDANTAYLHRAAFAARLAATARRCHMPPHMGGRADGGQYPISNSKLRCAEQEHYTCTLARAHGKALPQDMVPWRSTEPSGMEHRGRDGRFGNRVAGLAAHTASAPPLRHLELSGYPTLRAHSSDVPALARHCAARVLPARRRDTQARERRLFITAPRRHSSASTLVLPA